MRRLGPVLLLGLLAGCWPSEQRVQRRIDDANWCSTAEDCVDLGSHCPFGCWVLVNENEATEVIRLLERYEAAPGPECLYDCPAHGPIACVNGTCEAEAADTGA